MNLSRGYLLALVIVFGLLSLLLVLPFVQYVLGAVLIAFVLYPLQERLERRTSPTIAAFALVVFALAGLVIPFVVVIAAVAGDAARMVENLDPEALQLAEIEARIAEETGRQVDLASTLTNAGENVGRTVLERSPEAFTTLTHILVGFGLALFLVYYLLRDGDDLVGWLRTTTPLPDDVQADFNRELSEVMWAVLYGHVLIAIIQGVLAGLGLFATGIPNAAFWTFVMIVLSLIPLIGAPIVWLPAVAYLFLQNEPILAGGLFVYSAIVVSVSDDYLRPVVVDRYAELSPAVIILGVLGGIYAFGIMGLFFGPVVLGALKATMNVVNEHYGELGDVDGGDVTGTQTDAGSDAAASPSAEPDVAGTGEPAIDSGRGRETDVDLEAEPDANVDPDPDGGHDGVTDPDADRSDDAVNDHDAGGDRT